MDMTEDFTKESVKLKQQEAELKDFCQQTGLYRDTNRYQVLGFDKSVSQKAVWSQKKTLLPHYQRAVIQKEKITGYVLNKQHKTGMDKAIAFEKALGYNIDNADDLIKNIYQNLSLYPAKLRPKTQYGQPFEVIMKLTGPNGKTAKVKTGWIIENGKNHPRLTSAYVAKR